MAMTSESRRPPESEFQAVRPAMVKVQLSDNYGMKILCGSWQNRNADVLQLWRLTCTALMGTVVQCLAMDTLVHCQVKLVRDVSSTQTQWATLTFDLAFRWAFRWAKLRSKSRLKWKSKSKVISLRERLRSNLQSKYILRPKLSWTTRGKSPGRGSGGSWSFFVNECLNFDVLEEKT